MSTKTGRSLLYAGLDAHRRPLRGMRLLALLALIVIAVMPFRPVLAQTSPQGDSNAYVEATVNNTNPFVGEELTYIFRYYEAVDAIQLPNILVGQPDYDAPEFANFWQEGEITQINYQQRVNDRLYNVSELHTTIFPTAAGDLTIPPAKLILDGGFSGRRIELNTLPVTVSVKTLPNGDSTLAAGAVGNYTLNAQVDATTTQVDEPITLQVVLRGTGNIRLAPAAPIPQMDGWRVLEQNTEIDVEPLYGLDGETSEPQMGGTRTATYLLIPAQAGVFTIPPLEYAFFDPAAGETRFAFTNPIDVTVQAAPGAILAAEAQPATQADAFDSPLAVASTAGSNPGAAPVAPDAGESSAAQSSTESAAIDNASGAGLAMAPLVVGILRQSTAPLASEAWYWALWTLPLAAVAIAGWTAWRSRQAPQRQAMNQRARAGSDALRQMHGQHTASPADMAASAQKALLDFIGRKLNQPVLAMPRTTLAAELLARGVQPSLAQQVAECMRLGDMARFSPAGVDAYSAMQMQATVEATIRELDKVL